MNKLMIFLVVLLAFSPVYAIEKKGMVGSKEMTYISHDGSVKSVSKMDIGTNDYPYLLVDNDTFYTVSRYNKSLRLPKKSWITWTFTPEKISLRFTVDSMTKLQSVSASYTDNKTVRFIVINSDLFGYKKVGKLIQYGDFFWDSKLRIYDSSKNVIEDIGENYTAPSYYDVQGNSKFKVFNNELRIYFDDLAWFKNAVYPVYFDFDSWIIGSNQVEDFWNNATRYNITTDENSYAILDPYILGYNRTIDNGLAAFWRFNEGINSTAYGESDNNNDGTITGAIWTTGKYGNALDFGGASDYVEVPYNNSLNFSDFITISFWLKLTGSTGANQYIIDQGDGTWKWAILYSNANGKVSFYVHNGTLSKFKTTTSAISLGAWHHIVATYNSSNQDMSIFHNGILNNSGTVAMTGNIRTDISPPVEMARKFTTSLNYLNGTLDEVMIFNRSLSASEIQELYNSSYPAHGNLTINNSNNNMTEYVSNVSFSGEISTGTNISITLFDAINSELLCSACSPYLNYTPSQDFLVVGSLFNFSFLANSSNYTPFLHNITLYNYTLPPTPSPTTPATTTTTTTLLSDNLTIVDVQIEEPKDFSLMGLDEKEVALLLFGIFVVISYYRAVKK